MHNDLSHRKILRQSDKSFIQLCIHKLEVKMSKLASGTTLKFKVDVHPLKAQQHEEGNLNERNGSAKLV